MKEYFSHDYNARNDKKLIKLFMKHGVSGIGIYWCIIEMLYEESGYLSINEYERITFELRTDYEIVKSVINDFELFKIKDDLFYSESAINRLNERSNKSQKARESINKRWEKIKNNTNVLRTYNDSNTIKVKESKVKESKEYTWRNNFEIYKNELDIWFENIKTDFEYLKEQEKFNPGIDVILSIEKSIKVFWGTEAGWKNKKSSKTLNIDWKQTIAKNLDKNRVFKIQTPQTQQQKTVAPIIYEKIK